MSLYILFSIGLNARHIDEGRINNFGFLGFLDYFSINLILIHTLFNSFLYHSKIIKCNFVNKISFIFGIITILLTARKSISLCSFYGLNFFIL